MSEFAAGEHADDVWPMMLASVCLLVGLVIGGCGATMLRAWAMRGRPALSARDEESNVFDGTVFPAPHDARWRLEERGWCFPCTSGPIVLCRMDLMVGTTLVERGGAVSAYLDAVNRAQADLARTMVLSRVWPAILNEPLRKAEPNTAGPYFDGTPEKREVPQLVAMNQQANAATGLLGARDARSARYPGTSPVFRVDDAHVLPHPSADGWKHGDSDRQPSVFIGGGGHSLTVFKDGDVFLDAGKWFKHKKASELYDLVVAHLPRKVSEADKQRMAAEEMMAKLTKARA